MIKNVESMEVGKGKTAWRHDFFNYHLNRLQSANTPRRWVSININHPFHPINICGINSSISSLNQRGLHFLESHQCCPVQIPLSSRMFPFLFFFMPFKEHIFVNSKFQGTPFKPMMVFRKLAPNGLMSGFRKYTLW